MLQSATVVCVAGLAVASGPPLGGSGVPLARRNSRAPRRFAADGPWLEKSAKPIRVPDARGLFVVAIVFATRRTRANLATEADA